MATSRAQPINSPQQRQMFPLQMTTPVPTHYVGRDISLMGTAEDGGFYYCKTDSDNRPVRVTELLFTALASDIGIATAPFNVVQYENGNTYFGSRTSDSPSSADEVATYFRVRSFDELGGYDQSKSTMIARLYVYDMFIGNPDRSLHNMLAVRDGGFRRIAAIDFADASLFASPLRGFPSDNSKTVRWRRILDNTHPFAHDAAMEMLTRLGAVPVSFFESIFDRLQPGWAQAEKQGQFLEFWGSDQRQARLSALGVGLKDGSLR